MKKLLVLGLVLFAACNVVRDPGYVVAEVYNPSPAEKAVWDSLIGQGVDEIVFVKRNHYNATHYYTEYLQGDFMPGGNICVLSLHTGEVRELVPSMSDGVFGKFDVSYDGKKIIFPWKASYDLGYRIYEIGIDGNDLRQFTFSPENEAETVEKYKIWGYHHGTEDLDPCYLPDGGIAFISTRAHFGTLCDEPDLLTTTNIYRMDGDGGNMRKLTNSSVSENTPCVLPDGRIMYTRWEYVDKGAVSVKCLWAMMPDGSGSVEIYGNDISVPPTMIFARPIPGSSNEYVMTGTPHCPQNCVGTVIRLDMTKNIRTREPMTYMTPDVDIQEEPGFRYRDTPDGEWRFDYDGRGRLFRETYPLSRSEFLVSHKPAGTPWNHRTSYDLFLLNENGKVAQIYADTSISCFNPMPLRSREREPVIPSKLDPELAAQGIAECIVTDVYQGLTGVERGEIKYIRVMEQVPRPWGARRYYGGDNYDQQHATITKDTHLGLKVQHGIVPVEDDGSARFLVPAEANIFLQVLDGNFMAVQTERTYINYMPGEVRSCVGCHETQVQTPQADGRSRPKALARKAEFPMAQPWDDNARRTLSYARDVQPVWDKHCISCHSGANPPGRLDLSGEMTELFNVSYENLIPERRKGFYDRGVLGPVIGENHPKTGNVHYLPARSLGSHASILVAILAPGKVKITDPEVRKRSEALAKKHSGIDVAPEELLRVTNWVDTNGQYYGTYYGKRNLRYKDEPDFRTEYGYDEAIAPQPPYPAVLSENFGK